MPDEPLFMAIRGCDPAFQQTVRDAQASLSEFRQLLLLPNADRWYPCVKTPIDAGADHAFIWLGVVRVMPSSFVGSIFEIPPEFKGIRVGDKLEVADDKVMDWMVNQDGELRGGFSLRYQRSMLPPEKRDGFDKYIGVVRYV